MDRLAMQALMSEGLEGLDEEGGDLDGLTEETQLKVQGLMRAEVRIGTLRGAEEESARRIGGGFVTGLDAPLRLKEHGIGAGVAAGTGGCAGTVGVADGTLKYGAEGPAQHVTADFKREVEWRFRQKFKPEPDHAQCWDFKYHRIIAQGHLNPDKQAASGSSEKGFRESLRTCCIVGSVKEATFSS
jgi:hypothetical protein